MKMILSTASILLTLFVFCHHTVLVQGVAADQHQNCEEWALHGECEKNPGYMLTSCATSCAAAAGDKEALRKEVEHIPSFFDLKAKDIDGNDMDFSKFRGTTTVITNVASYCGRTDDHYRGLADLHKFFKTEQEPMQIIAFPCNQFGQQEPGTAQEIKQFAKSKGAEFTMMEKVDVNGPNTSLVYKYLKYHSDVDMIKWNFDTYFVVDGEGNIEHFNDVDPSEIMAVLQGGSDEPEF